MKICDFVKCCCIHDNLVLCIHFCMLILLKTMKKINVFCLNDAASTDFLPFANTPEVFGLHPNAEINYYSQTAREIWSHLIELQPQTGKLT